MKKSALVIALPLLAAGAVTSAAWYTGSRIEQFLAAELEQANKDIAQQMPGLRISLEDYERGLFSSSARYHLHLPASETGEEDVVVLAEHIEHGPFPLSRLSQGELEPVMATLQTSLERTPFVEPWFDAASGQAPLLANAIVDFEGRQRGEATLAAVSFSSDTHALTVDPTRVWFEVAADHRTTSIKASLDRVELQPTDLNSGNPVHLLMRDLTLSADKASNAAGFGIGPSRFAVKSIEMSPADGPRITFNNLSMDEKLAQRGKALDQTVAYRVGALSVGDQQVGALDLSLSLSGIDEAALQEFAEIYNRIVFASLESDGAFSGVLTPAQEAELQAGALKLLVGGPKVALDELSLKTANGEARAALAVVLGQPDPNAPTLGDLAGSIVTSLEAKLKVDKALVGDLAALQASAQGGTTDPAELAEVSAMAGEAFSGMALESNLALLDGQSLVSALSYGNGRVVFNGQEMSVEEFVGFVMGTAQFFDQPH